MLTRWLTVGSMVLMAVLSSTQSDAQEQSQPPLATEPAQEPPPAPAGDLPAVPKGVEVLARGPVHEAFATPTTDPVPTRPVDKKPPKALDEMPPDQKPEGEVVWISGYWAWDDDRKDFLWVSGIWRTVPPGKRWVAGYWREIGSGSQWVPGFWTAAAEADAKQDVTYLPAPPPPPEMAAPGEPPSAESFYVPGAYYWGGDHYLWRAGYWARVQPGYVWVPAHFRWTPGGYIYISGYWDLALPRRGVMFAPVVIDTAYVGPGFVYTPAYVVSNTVVIDAMFVRPCYCHYYFGDYYGPVYRGWGFESCAVYGRSHYDSIYVYSRWEHRSEPAWATVQLDICLARHAGQAPCPPRTLVQQTTIINNVTNVTNVTNVRNVTRNTNATVLLPASQMRTVTGTRTVALDTTTRMNARQQSQSNQHVAMQRSQNEVVSPGGPSLRPRTTSLSVPNNQPVLSRSEPAPRTAVRTPSGAGNFQSSPAGGAHPSASTANGTGNFQASPAGGFHPASGTNQSIQGHPTSGQPSPYSSNGSTAPRQPYRPGQPMPQSLRRMPITTQHQPQSQQSPPKRPSGNGPQDR